jgi:hypothetical protein
VGQAGAKKKATAKIAFIKIFLFDLLVRLSGMQGLVAAAVAYVPFAHIASAFGRSAGSKYGSDCNSEYKD